MELKKILVPVSGSQADGEAMRLACRLARKEKGKVWAVSVVAIKRALPLDAEIDSEIKNAENLLDHVESVAEEYRPEIGEFVLLIHQNFDDALGTLAPFKSLSAKYKGCRFRDVFYT